MDYSDCIYTKEGIVLIVQVDHVSGEILGTAIEDLYQAGAHNVQVISSITKKNRPGYLVFIDTHSNALASIENTIIEDLAATGWHVLRTDHRHIATEIIVRRVEFATPQGIYQCTAEIKMQKSNPDELRPEHSSCLSIRKALAERGLDLPLHRISQSIVEQVKNTGK